MRGKEILRVFMIGLAAMSAQAFAPPRYSFPSTPQNLMQLKSSKEMPFQEDELRSGENPCWQDLYDDDCSMTSFYSATFVPSQWIKSMPCGAGIEDCDMPTDLTLPETRPEAGVDRIDVMDFLGLKRAGSLNIMDDGKASLEP